MSRLHKRFVLVLIVLGIFPDLLRAQATTSGTPIRIKVVVVAMFERGEDTEDAPGEYQLWVDASTWIKLFLSRPGITMCA